MNRPASLSPESILRRDWRGLFREAVQASEAMLRAGERNTRTLVPALAGCFSCQTVRMIAAPALGLCRECGADLSLLGAADPTGHGAADAPRPVPA